MLRFRILGAFEVSDGGRPLELGGAQQRALLGALVVHRREVVSTHRLIDELWGASPPATAAKTVQVYVSRLRKVLGADALVTEGRGYRLDVSAEQVDADRFEALAARGRQALAEGDAEQGSELLAEALALWGGEPLADFTYESFAQDEIARLSEVRLAATEDRIDADIALGRHELVAGELETLTRAHPNRERLAGQRMLALYRSGRQAEALEVYREHRQHLVNELGLEPGPELQRLERAILAQDPALEGPPRRGPLAAGGRRRRSGLLLAFGGGLLLAAAIAAILAIGAEEGSEPVAANSLAVIDPASDGVVAAVPTGVRPADVSADADSVWVANRDDDTVTQIDPKTQAVVSTTAAGTGVGGLAAGAGAVWIGDSRGEELVRLEPDFGSRRSIRLASGPQVFGFDLNPVAVGGGDVWVGKAPGGVAQVDPDSDRVVGKVAVGNGPNAIATGLGDVWVADDVDNTLTRIDAESANAVTATTPVGQGPAAVAVGEDAVWVANTQDDTVSRVDPETATVTETIAVGARPTGIAAGSGAVWVANSLDGTVSRIDPDANQVTATIEVGEAPQSVTVAHDLVWVTVQASAAPPETPTTPAEDDVARLIVASDPGPLDPALSNDLDDYMRVGATCASLYNYPDRPFPLGARLQPEVATGEPSVSGDGRTYEFTLRRGFRFSPPSNEPVTPEAFERAIERVLDPRMGSYADVLAKDIVGADDYAAGRARHVAGVATRGDTLSVQVERPAGNVVERLSSPWFCAVPPDAPIDGEGVDLLPSAGPYYVASYVPDRSFVLRRNPNYAGERPHQLEEIRFEIGASPERGVEEVEAGEADYVALNPLVETAAPPDVFRRLTAEYGPRSEAARAGRQQLFTQPQPVLYYFIFNPERGRFDDVGLRRAVNYAIDRPALAANAGLGQRGRPTDQYIPPGMPGFEDAAIYPLGGPDLATARRLAGDAKGPAVLYTCDLPDCTRHAGILRSNLGAIGIELEIRQFPLEEFFTRISKPGEPFDLTYWNWIFDYADPATFINDQFSTKRFGLPPVVTDPEIQRRMEAAALLTGDARLRAYARLDRDLAEQVVPAAAFASGTITHFFSARMGCQILHPIYVLDLVTLCVRDEGEAE